jgi:hypothetical protein
LGGGGHCVILKKIFGARFFGVVGLNMPHKKHRWGQKKTYKPQTAPSAAFFNYLHLMYTIDTLVFPSH